jgi:hypothetical protein
MSYWWICKGYYIPGTDSEGRQIMTNTKIDTQCYLRPLQGNKIYSLRQELEKDLYPSVHALLDGMEDVKYNVGEIAWVWMAGVICALLVVALFPWSFRRTKMLGGKYWCLIPCFLAVVSSGSLVSRLATTSSLCQW